jgi:hypothetical protein
LDWVPSTQTRVECASRLKFLHRLRLVISRSWKVSAEFYL